mmetsp:Transcript_16146/g.36329  ORF Transcript_16146/g.36329 Transcript_16146/m.36329 type:complete len:106 (+) Transcript_16146:383-700(+)
MLFRASELQIVCPHPSNLTGIISPSASPGHSRRSRNASFSFPHPPIQFCPSNTNISEGREDSFGHCRKSNDVILGKIDRKLCGRSVKFLHCLKSKTSKALKTQST